MEHEENTKNFKDKSTFAQLFDRLEKLRHEIDGHLERNRSLRRQSQQQRAQRRATNENLPDRRQHPRD